MKDNENQRDFLERRLVVDLKGQLYSLGKENRILPMESSMLRSVVLLILGSVASSLFMAGYLSEAIVLTALGLTICFYFSRKARKFEETLRDKPVY